MTNLQSLFDSPQGFPEALFETDFISPIHNLEFSILTTSPMPDCHTQVSLSLYLITMQKTLNGLMEKGKKKETK